MVPVIAILLATGAVGLYEEERRPPESASPYVSLQLSPSLRRPADAEGTEPGSSTSSNSSCSDPSSSRPWDV